MKKDYIIGFLSVAVLYLLWDNNKKDTKALVEKIIPSESSKRSESDIESCKEAVEKVITQLMMTMRISQEARQKMFGSLWRSAWHSWRMQPAICLT